MPTLTQTLPALRQSSVETAACPRAYVEIEINGKKQPDSIPSERGTDIHRVMAKYVMHCAAESKSSDWEEFNRLAEASGPVAGKILDGIRDSYEVDWKHVFACEMTLALDEEFRPLNEGLLFTQFPNVDRAAYIGTLDVILLKNDGTAAKIDDYKSHPSPFEADTFQGTLYPFMLFKHLPDLEMVTFELNFVRYTNCYRRVTWHRSDMPAMQAIISRARERQRITHENPDEALALPCKTCTYCPLAKNMSCPIAEWNEYTTMTPPQRLMWKEWMRRMATINTPLLKAYAEVDGAVRYQDGNGRVYEYGEMAVPSTRFPLDRTTIDVLEAHKNATGEDLLDGKLSISSTTIKPKLKAKKRASLLQTFEDSIIETSTKPKFAVRTPDEGIVSEYNPYEQED